MPGPPAFDDIRMEVTPTGATAADLDQWVSQAALGTATPRDGVIELLSQNLTVVLRQVNLFDLFPASFTPFPNAANRRTIILNLGRFSLQ